MERLAKENKELEEMWEKRWKKLQDGLELQKFNREGDRINAALSGHEAFLRGDDLGVCAAADLVFSCFFFPSREQQQSLLDWLLDSCDHGISMLGN